MVGCLVLAIARPVMALPKTAEKGLFATGLLAFGVVVTRLIRRDEEASCRRIAEFRAQWGEPVRVRAFRKGFDVLRVEEYRRENRRAVVTFRNERFFRVETPR